jgi:hypothetical protein
MGLERILTLILVGISVPFCVVNLGFGTLFFYVDSTVFVEVARRQTSSASDFGIPTRRKDVRDTNAGVATSDTSQLSVSVRSPSDNVEPIPRPPLDSIVQGWNITGDPSWLLQFSVVGFPKSGTSTLMFHLQSHPEIHMHTDERCEMASNQHAVLMRDLYNDFPAGVTYKRGIKCPFELENTKVSMRNYHRWFPNTDFIVGIRHPILWCVHFGLWNFVTAFTSKLRAVANYVHP